MTDDTSKEYQSHHDGDQVSYHIQKDAHRPTSILADVILGGQDGLVNVLGIVLGVVQFVGAKGDQGGNAAVHSGQVSGVVVRDLTAQVHSIHPTLLFDGVMFDVPHL